MTQVGELVITRVFDAPRELVFECITKPEHITHFWGPVGTSAPRERITIDLRPGGIFETVMVDDSTGAEYASRCVYTQVDPPETLVWTDPENGTTTTSTFVDLGDGRTEVRIHQANLPEGFATAQAQAGFNSSLDRFETYLGTIS